MFGELYSDLLLKEYNNGNTNISSSNPELGLVLLSNIIDPDYEFINMGQVEFPSEK